MKILLLLAGQSKRFWPLSEKTLFPICGTTLLDIQIEHLGSAGLDDVILVGGAHNLEEASARYPKLKTIEQEDLDLGMRGALLSALPECGDEPVMVVSGNDVVEPSAYKSLVENAQEKGGVLLAYRVNKYFPGGYLEVDGDRITSIIEKPGEGNEPSDLVNIVAHVHNNPALLLETLKNVKPKRDDGYEQALATLFPQHEYSAVAYEGFWQAVKYPWHLLQLSDFLLKQVQEQQIHPSAQIHPTSVIEGPVIIEEGVKVFPHATIKGPCIIGPRSVIANNALVRGSSIGADCVIGFSSEVKASVLHSHVWTHMSYVGDSIIGSNVSFGSGCATGNLRLDEAVIPSTVQGEEVSTGLTKFGTVIGNDCRIGIHASLNPGIKIGAGSFVSSHVALSSDVPEGSFVRMKKGEVVVCKNKTHAPKPEKRAEFRQKAGF